MELGNNTSMTPTVICEISLQKQIWSHSSSCCQFGLRQAVQMGRQFF